MKVTQQEVDKPKWFHTIDIGDGVVSKGIKPARTIYRGRPMHSSNMGWKVNRFWTLEPGTGSSALRPIGAA